MKHRATIYDVARLADVSLATVSRVINKTQKVKESTRLKVEEAIETLGYKTNEYARGLAVQKTTNICIISNANFLQYNQKIITGMMDVAKIYNYNVFIHTVSRGISNMTDIVDSIVKKRIDGVILFKGHFSKTELDMLEESGIPSVIVGTDYDITKNENVANVFVDFKKIGYELAKKYLDKGMDDICFVRDHVNTSISSQIIEGISKAYDEVNKKFEDIIVYGSRGSSYLPLQSILQNKKPSKLMVTVRDTHAFSILNTYKEQGYTCPEDFELINILDSKYLNMFRPQISSYGIPEYDMGAIGCRLLTKMLEDEAYPELKNELSYFLLDRQTTK